MIRVFASLVCLLAVSAGCIDGPGGSAVPLGETEHADRWAHFRIMADDGELLYSTWPGEDGPLEALEVEEPRPMSWPRGEIPPRLSIWTPFVRDLANAAPNATLRFEDHVVPELRQERLVLPRSFETARYQVMPRDGVIEVLANASAGARVYYLGLIPIDVLAVDNESVVFRYAAEDDSRLSLPRASGLDLVTRSVGGGLLRFELDAPSGTFTAHNNCQAPSQLLTSGFYVVRETTLESLIVDRYVGAIEPTIVGRVLDIEVTFFDGAPSPGADLQHEQEI